MEKISMENNSNEEVKNVDRQFIQMPNGTTIDITGLSPEEKQEIIEQLRESLSGNNN